MDEAAINEMAESTLDAMKSQVGFDPADTENLVSLAQAVEPAIPAIVEHSYDRLLKHQATRALLGGDPGQLPRLSRMLSDWLAQLLCGVYDYTSRDKRARIARAHVQAGLPPHYIVAAVEVIWQELEDAVRRAQVPDVNAKLRSLHKVLTIELGCMLETYKESYAAKVKAKERSVVEEKLSRAERLAVIGQLAASLAHEIKNPLAGISGAIQVIRDGMASDHKHRAIIGEILGQINRLDAVVKDLLIYARPVPPRLVPCSLDAIVRRTLTFMREEFSTQQVPIDFGGAGDEALILADEPKIEQLVLNLLLNAVQASCDGGAIQVATAADADSVVLAVEDTGHGMDETVRQRAFEPFYTTKTKGTGLGLPICKGIVDAHAGSISLQSAVGKGTRVTVELPRAERPEH